MRFGYLVFQGIIIDGRPQETANHQPHHRRRWRGGHEQGDAQAGDAVGQRDVNLGGAHPAGRYQRQDKAQGHHPQSPPGTSPSLPAVHEE